MDDVKEEVAFKEFVIVEELIYRDTRRKRERDIKLISGQDDLNVEEILFGV